MHNNSLEIEVFNKWSLTVVLNAMCTNFAQMIGKRYIMNVSSNFFVTNYKDECY